MTSITSFSYVLWAYGGVGTFFMIALIMAYRWQRRLDP